LVENLEKEKKIETCICCEDLWEHLFESLSNSVKEIFSTGFCLLIEVPCGIASGLLNFIENK